MILNYDYIIIGAGSAGCVLANRLSANPSNKVLLVEAGGQDNKMEIHIPGGYAKLHRSKVDWGGYWTEPQEHALNRKIYLPRGKVLGGCSSTNAMVYVRGNKEDYNDWAAMGNKGWGYADVLPYFKKSEHNEDIQNQYHGQNGKLNVAFAKRFQTPFVKAFVEACGQCGFPKNNDYNGERMEGAGPFQFTIKNSKRNSSAVAFLQPATRRKNLTVLTNTHTKKIIIKNDKAVGVEVMTNKNASQEIWASKEIILSAGSFASPQLLMLSGIGNKEELKNVGIDCIKHLPGVGKNLQDHLFYAVSALATIRGGQNHHIKPMQQVIDLVNYFAFKKGALTIGPLEAVAFGSTSLSPNRVDYQFQFAPFQVGNQYNTDIYDLKTFPLNEDGFTILPTLLRPKSRGYLALRSNNPFDFPIIQPNFLSEEADKKVMVEAGKKAIEVLQASAFNSYRKQLICPPDYSSDEAILLHILKSMETVYHPVGTCKMGNDEMAVVDNQLRIHHIENLRVVDASIMPSIVSGNTNAPVYMIAEKAADMILGFGKR
jgi:choline dehydrogenase